MQKIAKKTALSCLGWREWVALPQLNIPAIKTKIDTGARTSSLHAFDLQFIKIRKENWVRFALHPFQHNSKREVSTQARIIDQRWVRSSSGQTSLRPIIVTEIVLGGKCWVIELALVNRDQMGFRMLLGRRAIKGRFLVDPGRAFLLGQYAEQRNA